MGSVTGGPESFDMLPPAYASKPGSFAEFAPRGNGASGLTIVLLFAQRLALVVFPLTLGDRNFHFGPAIKEIQAQGHQCVSPGGNPVGKLHDLVLVEKEFALSSRGVIGPSSLVVFGYMDSLQPRLAA